ncbi:MAG: hypothetical protein ACNS61_08885 [Candidatus Wenzhouxiangella sp. M2_3B_020]
MKNSHLTVAGLLSLAAGLLHFAIILGGPDWYRFFGAGEVMAQLAEQGHGYPAVITSAIATILIGWGLYAFSGAGLIRRLPFLRTCLILITGVYLLRGLAGLILPLVSDHPQIEMRSPEFWLWSSLLCLVFGAVHVSGLLRAWPDFAVGRITSASTADAARDGSTSHGQP